MVTRIRDTGIASRIALRKWAGIPSIRPTVRRTRSRDKRHNKLVRTDA